MNRNKGIIKTSIIGIFVNVILVVFKAIIGLISASVSIILDAVNNLSDALSSLITIIGTKISGKPADHKHPYGYGRIEYISSSIISVIILVAGVTSVIESIKKIIHPTETNFNVYSLIVIIAALVVKLLLGIYTIRRGKKLHSDSLMGSGKEAMMDSIVSSSTLLAIVVSLIFKDVNIDGYVGALISVFIIKAGLEILIETLSKIIGTRIDKKLSDGIKDIVLSYDEVLGAYDLSIHEYGVEQLIGSIHIEVNDNMTAKEIHYLTRNIQTSVYNEYHVILTVGIYASNNLDDFKKSVKNSILEELSKYDTFKEMHGFYYEEKTKTFTFDMIFDFSQKNIMDIKNDVEQKLALKYEGYNFYAILDKDLTD